MTRSDALPSVRVPRQCAAMLVLAVAGLCGLMPVMAQQRGDAPASTGSAVTLPSWERLTPAQRGQLIGPLRERWNANPDQRARLMGHAQRWQQLTPDQRRRAHRGRERLQHMTPGQRTEARAAFQRMRDMPQAERAALREKLRAMTPEQRAQWLQAQRPKTDASGAADARK